MRSKILEIQKMDKECLLKETMNLVQKNQETCNSFVTILDSVTVKNDSEHVLSNIPYVLKDNFSTKGILTTGSSNTLKNYIPPFSATVYEALENAGALLVAKSVMDEFGMGGTGTTGHTGVVRNPWNTECIAGGSSAGSAACVSSGVVPFSIGSDTGDSIRKPAAYCGIVGYKPTYGMISRYGLFPFASSLDHVGVLSRYVYDAALVVQSIKGIDEKDMTSFDSRDIDLISSIDQDISSKKLFYIKEIADLDSYESPSEELKRTIRLFHETLDKIRSLGVVIDAVSFDKNLLEVLPSVYTCISSAEATSNMSNLTGIPFGVRGEGKSVTDMMMDHRTKGFSPLIKRRFVIGSYVLQKENQDKYFVNAMRVRNLIVMKMKEFFDVYDACILPCAEGGAPKISSVSDMMKKDFAILENHMVIGNFGGFPSITIPNGLVDSMPLGINLTSNIKEDAKLLNLAYKIEEIIDFKGGLQ